MQRVTPCPQGFLASFYWYGQKQCSSGKVPQWLEKLSACERMDNGCDSDTVTTESEVPEQSLSAGNVEGEKELAPDK